MMSKSPLDRAFAEREAMGTECLVPTVYGVTVDTAPKAQAEMRLLAAIDVALANQRPLLPERRYSEQITRHYRSTCSDTASADHERGICSCYGQAVCTTGRPAQDKHERIEARERADDAKRERLLATGVTRREAPLNSRQRREMRRLANGTYKPGSDR